MPLILPTEWALFPVHGISPEGKCLCGHPCDNAGKHPKSKWGGLGPGDKHPIEEGDNVGLATGARSGVIVVDLDFKPVGHPKHPLGLNGLGVLRELGDPGDTLAVITPSGGFHLYFLAPNFKVKNSVGEVGRGLGPNPANSGIDIRGDGGYVVIPDSVHKSGGTYKFLDVPDGTNPMDKVRPLPDWLAGRIGEGGPGFGGAPFPVPAFPSLTPEVLETSEEGMRAIDRAVEVLRKTADGMRNQVLFRVAAELGDRAHVGDLAIQDARVAISTFLYTSGWGDPEKTLDTMERGFVKGLSKQRCMVVIGPDHEACNDQAITGLATRDDVYVIGNALARDTGGNGISAISHNNLREVLASCVDWRQRSKEGELKRVHPPEWATGEVLDRGFWDGLRIVTGFARTPVLRSDGSVALEAGWDEKTGVVLGESWDEVTMDVATAKAFLDETFQDFPFASESHRGALMCALLTPLAVHAFEGPIPLFFFDASVAGAGKGKLATICALVSTGEDPAMSMYKDNEEEMRKFITTCAKNPKPIIFLDNVEGEFGGSVLCSVLTSPSRIWHDRILGGNTAFTGKLNSVIYATGNNARLGQDMERRVIPVRIVPDVERPELREGFRHANLEAWVKENLRPLTWAALALLRGFMAAGSPFRGRSWGSYEEWSRLVVGTVVWAGYESPSDAVETMRGGTDGLNDGAALIEACAAFGAFTAKEALDAAYPKTTFGAQPMKGAEALREYLDDHYPAPKQCTILQLACLLRRYKDRVFGGRSIKECGKRQNLITWRVG